MRLWGGVKSSPDGTFPPFPGQERIPGIIPTEGQRDRATESRRVARALNLEVRNAERNGGAESAET
jgi:hypothetical protein